MPMAGNPATDPSFRAMMLPPESMRISNPAWLINDMM